MSIRSLCWRSVGAVLVLISAVIVANLLASDTCDNADQCECPEDWPTKWCARAECFGGRDDPRCKGEPNGKTTGQGTWCWEGRLTRKCQKKQGILEMVRDASPDVPNAFGGKYLKALPVLLTMWLTPSNRKAAIQGCGMLSNFGWNDPMSKDVMMFMGAIRIVIKTILPYYYNDKPVENSCFNAIAALSLYNRRTSLRVGELGGVEMTADFWRRNFDDPDAVVANYFGCYQDYAPENRARMREAGTIKMMFDACGEGGKHYWHAGAQFSVWCAFSSFHSKENHEEFRRLGGLRHLYVTFRDHGKSYRVREEILQATKGLCAYRANRDDLNKEGFAALLTEAVKEAKMDPQVSSLGMETLRMFVEADDARRAALIADDGLNISFDALTIHAGQLLNTRADWDAQNVYGSINDDQYCVPGAATELLYSMALDGPETRKIILEAQGIKRIEDAIRATSKRVQSVRFRTWRAGCAVLHKVAGEAKALGQEADLIDAMTGSGCLPTPMYPDIITNDVKFEP